MKNTHLGWHNHFLRGDVQIPTYKPHTNHKKPSVSSHTLAPTTICDLSYSICGSPLADLGHISSVTYVCHPLWFVCGHRKGILMSKKTQHKLCKIVIKNNNQEVMWRSVTLRRFFIFWKVIYNIKISSGYKM